MTSFIVRSVRLATSLFVCGAIAPPALFAQEKPVPVLTRFGIEQDERKIAARIYNEVVNIDDLKKGVGHFVSETDRRARARAVELGSTPSAIASMAGAWMEYSLMIALKQRGKIPFYWQVDFKEFRNNFFDIVLFTKEHGPIALNPKTSLRERYKQADVEGRALLGMFPGAKCYLLTLDANKNHVANVKRKIADGELKGLTALHDETDLDALFKFLDTLTLIAPKDGVLNRFLRRIE